MSAAYRDVEFDGERSVLRGRLYGHDSARPAVVMAHGFSATISGMVADRYAEVLHDTGLTVLLFDHEGFGLSGGEPRAVVNRWLQCRGYLHALEFASAQASVDRDRIGLWGDSFSASVALTVAACDERVAALVVQVPSCGVALGEAGSRARGLKLARELLYDRDVLVDAVIGEELPVVSPDQETQPSQLVPLTAYRWFSEYGPRVGTGWLPTARRATIATDPPYTTDAVVGALRCPSLWVIANDDEMPGSGTDVALKCFALAGGAAEKRMIAGGHFGLLYDESPLFAEVSAAQAEFLVRALHCL
ncbi:alpha/beta hydrolase [Gryllotalpicola protaetiae]|uniref:Alpha/beta hydrolase n=1 Tax=Gryllotalpicola protaetiae TaxID=2419771 RepID=A0A387BZQ9_9MICO|nr:alpha/beta hydrolase [Gryllotalpicola protaetiae]AYG03831.1 alpha/beta hydrolase [Gryllotalpicola protaetiae]